MSHITKGYCKTCGKYYEGRGKFYCSNVCCKKDSEYQTKRSKTLMGKPTWNKGKHLKLNDALIKWRKNGGRVWNKGIKGLQLSPLTQFKKNDIRITGENNTNWNGGVTDKNTKIRKSVEYKQWRKSVYFRDKWTCQHCGKKCQSKDVVAHHIYYFSVIPELRFSVKNGITLCRSCHFKLHQKNKNIDPVLNEVAMRPENYNWLLKEYDILGQNI